MKRDLELCRDILLCIEEDRQVSGLSRTEKELVYHIDILIEAGLVLGQVSRSATGETKGVAFWRLTWAGHEFLDASRNSTMWSKTVEAVRKNGGAWTLAVVQAMLVELLKKNLISQ